MSLSRRLWLDASLVTLFVLLMILTLPATSLRAWGEREGEDYWLPFISSEGYRGHLVIPSALPTPDGYFFLGLGSNTNQTRFQGLRQNTYLLSLGYLPGLELSLRYTVFPDTVDPSLAPTFGDIKDRSLAFKFSSYYLLKNSQGQPLPIQLALGATDIVGRSRQQEALYGVMGADWGRLRIDLGAGTERFSGLFGGATYRLSRHLALSADFDTEDLSLGAHIRPSRWLQLTAGYTLGEGSVLGAYFSGPLSRREKLYPLGSPPSREGVEITYDSLGESWAEKIRDRLLSYGLEDVRLTGGDDWLAVEFTDRRFRDPLVGYGVVLVELARHAPLGYESFSVTHLVDRTPLATLTVPRSALVEFVAGRKSLADFALTVQADWDGPPSHGDRLAGRSGSSLRKLDLELLPSVDINLGLERNPFEKSLRLRLVEQLPLMPHLSLQGRQGVVLSTDFPGEEEGDRLYERLFARLNFRTPGNSPLLLQLEGGRLSPLEEGIRGELRWETGAAGLPFYFSVEGARVRWREARQWENLLLGGAGLRVPRYDLDLSLLGGQFLDGDQGLLVSMERSFGLNSIRLFAFNTNQSDTEGGLEVLLSDPFYKRPRPEAIRIMPVALYPYRVITTTDPVGRTLRTGGGISRLLLRATPDYILTHLEVIREVARWMLSN